MISPPFYRDAAPNGAAACGGGLQRRRRGVVVEHESKQFSFLING
jgi:hypothetical protein